MSLSITQTPGVINPAYNPIYYNVYSIAYNNAGFRWTQDLSILGPVTAKPGITNPDFHTVNLGSYIKAPTNDYNQYWDPSRIAQTFLTYNFNPLITCIETSGRNCLGLLTNTLSYQTNTINKTQYDVNIETYIFNGGDDRNTFRNFNTSSVGIQQVEKPYNYIPNYFYADNARFLTHYNERTVDMESTGTLSVLNGVFSAKTTSSASKETIYAHTDTIDLYTYKNNTIQDKYMLLNYYRNNPAYYPGSGPDLDKNRITIPAYPKNLTLNKRWSFFDNYFTGGVGFISTTPHNLEVGDSIYIYQDAGYTHESYQGYATVTEVISPYIIGTDKAWAGNSPTNGGNIVKVGDYCSLSKIDDTILTYTGVTDDGNGFAMFNFEAGTDVSDIAMQSMFITSGSTNYPTDNYTESAGVYEVAIPLNTTSIISNIPYNGDDSGKMIIRQRTVPSDTVLFDDIDKYTMQLTYLSGETLEFLPYGETYTFNLVDACGKHDRIELFWLNKLGAFDSMLFRGKNTKEISFVKESYTRRLGDQTNSPFIYDVIDYTTNDFERQNFNGYQTTTYTLSTGWISESDGDRVIECMGSNTVYMYRDNVFVPVITTIENVQVKTKDNDKLIYYTISLQLTYNTISQRR